MTHLKFCALVAIVMAGLSMPPISPAQSSETPRLTIFAASSLTDALNDIGSAWRRGGHQMPRFSFASSAVIARQVAAGAPVDLVLSANLKWMTWLRRQKALEPGSATVIATNQLVLIAPGTDAPPLELTAAGLLQALAGGRLALGDPLSVPAGIYGKQALSRLGLWSSVEASLAPVTNVRAVLALVETGSVPLGLVFRTDARASRRVIVRADLDPALHEPITYLAAIPVGHLNPESQAFLAFLSSEEVRTILMTLGFGVPAL